MPWTVCEFTFEPQMTEPTFTFEKTVPAKYSISPVWRFGIRPICFAYSGVYMKWMAPSLLWNVWAHAAPPAATESTNAAAVPKAAARNEDIMGNPLVAGRARRPPPMAQQCDLAAVAARRCVGGK